MDFPKKSAPTNSGKADPPLLTQKWPKKSAPKQSGQGLDPPPLFRAMPGFKLLFFRWGFPKLHVL